MMLIITEKQEVADAVAAVFPNARKTYERYYDCGQTKITWCSGHLLALKDPEDYDPKYAKWNLADLPIPVQFPPQKKVVEGKGKALNQIIKLIGEASMIVNAGDTDDEGQYLVDEVIQYSGKAKGKPIKRLLINDNTPKAVKKALSNLVDNHQFRHLSLATEARSIADQLFGYNLTRAYTLRSPNTSKSPLSVGRVQTPILGLIVRRDLEKAAHVKSYYYELETQFEFGAIETKANYLKNTSDPVDSEGRMTDKVFLEQIVAKIKNKLALIKDKKVEQKQQAAPLPYNLLKLQVDCSRKFNISMDEVQQITQDLRVKYQLITYNRSSCEYLKEERHEEAPDVLKAIAANVAMFKSVVAKANPNLKSRAFNNKHVDAHHAIIPTETITDFSQLTEKERQVYQLIARQYLAQFYPLRTYEQTTLLIECQGILFTATSIKPLSEGWKVLYKNDQDNEAIEEEEKDCLQDLNQLAKGASGKNTLAEVLEKETKPKPHYTEHSLLIDLTRVANYVKDPKLKQVLVDRDKDKKGEHGGIGTPATRNEIIKTLFKRGFIETKGKGKTIISTKLGQDFYNALPDSVKYPDMTAIWHEQQQAISKGQMPVESFINHLEQFIAQEIHLLKTDAHYIKSFTTLAENQDKEASKHPCPKCGAPLRKIKGKEGLFWGCSGFPKCKATFPNGKNKPVLEPTKPKQN